jgi:hypothetical protein
MTTAEYRVARLALPTTDLPTYDVAQQARHVAIRVHPLYARLVRAQMRRDAIERNGKYAGRMYYWAKGHEIGRRLNPTLTPSSERHNAILAARSRVTALTDAIIADAFRVVPWPGGPGDMRAFVYWTTRSDIDSRLDVREPVPGAAELLAQAEALIAWAWAQPPSERERAAIARCAGDREYWRRRQAS